MEVSFCELRSKEVVNIYDGRSLGHIIDIVIDTHCARVTGIIVPGDRNFFNIFKSQSDFFIPYNRICKIGKDIILVELNHCKPQTMQQTAVLEHKRKQKENNASGYNHNISVSNEIYEGNFNNYVSEDGFDARKNTHLSPNDSL